MESLIIPPNPIHNYYLILTLEFKLIIVSKLSLNGSLYVWELFLYIGHRYKDEFRPLKTLINFVCPHG